MAIEIACPQCRKRFAAPDQWAGQTARCTDCGADIPVPSPSRSLEVASQQQLEWQPIAAQSAFAVPRRVSQPITIYWPLTIGIAVVFFALGFFVGREVLEWQQRRALQSIGEQFKQIMR